MTMCGSGGSAPGRTTVTASLAGETVAAVAANVKILKTALYSGFI
jgi:hypothetical protein